MLVRTASGFELEINKDTLDDWELLEDLAALEGGDRGRIVPVARRVLGPDGLSKLIEHCRTPEGRAPATAVETELFEIFKLLKEDQEEVKNS